MFCLLVCLFAHFFVLFCFYVDNYVKETLKLFWLLLFIVNINKKYFLLLLLFIDHVQITSLYNKMYFFFFIFWKRDDLHPFVRVYAVRVFLLLWIQFYPINIPNKKKKNSTKKSVTNLHFWKVFFSPALLVWFGFELYCMVFLLRKFVLISKF